MRGGPPRPVGAVIETAKPTGHVPKVCSSCGASIYWAQTESGKSMPVDSVPVAGGNVVLYDRGGSVRARILKKDELPAFGEKTRTSHFQTCPNAKRHRRGRRA